MMKTYLINILALLLFTCAGAMAQEQERKTAIADKHYKRYEYARAVKLYTEIADRKNPDPHVLRRAAESYRMMNRFEEAEAWYVRLLATPDIQPEDYYAYADVLMINGKFEEAKKNYLRYAEKKGMNVQLETKIASADSAAAWMARKSNYSLQNAAALNSGNSDWGAVYNGPTTIVFTSDRATPQSSSKKNKKNLNPVYGWNNRPYLRLYVAGTDSSQEPKALVIEQDKSDYHRGPIVFSADGETAYLTQTTEVPLKKLSASDKTSTDRLYTRQLQLVELKKKDGKWHEVRSFKYNNIKEYSVAHAALSHDGQTLYFASDMPGGKGKTDIWFCERLPDGEWGQPQNCGSNINTEGEESFPTIGPMNELYFSSDGRTGLGGLDIYRAKGQRSSWEKTENMLYPVNSTRDDFWFSTIDGKSGYISSNRKGGKGDDDLYSFTYQEPEVVIAISGIVLSKRSMEPLRNAVVTLTDQNGAVVSRKITEADGLFYFPLQKDADYHVRGNLKGFYPVDSIITTKGVISKSGIIRDRLPLIMDPLDEIGKTFVLNNIYYDLNKAEIRPDAALVLNELVNVLRDNPGLKIELSSHTDSRGSDAYNMKLSQRRAQSAVNYIVSQGIPQNRLVAKGYGESKPVNKCVNDVPCTDYEYQENRRTEFTILAY